MRRPIAIASIALVTLPLSACSFEDVAATAADAAACTALSSTIQGLSEAYQSGIVDSGVITQIDKLIGNQIDSVLSSGLADDLRNLTSALGETQTAQGAQQRVDDLLASVQERCGAVGIDVSQ
ncbi:MAG: hypothetical protein RL044_2 [Actinomycetota bacterium]|jgi:hypothetical protein